MKVVNQQNQMDNLIENLTQAYLLLYRSVKERKIKKFLDEIKNGEKYGKHQANQN